MSNENKNKHMRYEDRIEIQECLNKSMAFKAIAQRIGKSPTTVSREVKQHIQTHRNGYVQTDAICSKLLKAPFVCNGCEKGAEAAVSISDICILPKLLKRNTKNCFQRHGQAFP